MIQSSKKGSCLDNAVAHALHSIAASIAEKWIWKQQTNTLRSPAASAPCACGRRLQLPVGSSTGVRSSNWTADCVQGLGLAAVKVLMLLLLSSP